MKYPFISFATSFVIIFLIAFLLSFSFHAKKKTIIPATVEIDAEMLYEIAAEEEIKPVKKIKKIETLPLPTVPKKEKKLVRKKTQTQPKKKEKPTPNRNKETQKKVTKTLDPDSKHKVLVLHGPLPKIPDHLKEEAFTSQAIARFHIAKDGSSTVELIKPCRSPELNYLLLKSLAKWKFAASDKESEQEIRVNFIVE